MTPAHWFALAWLEVSLLVISLRLDPILEEPSEARRRTLLLIVLPAVAFLGLMACAFNALYAVLVTLRNVASNLVQAWQKPFVEVPTRLRDTAPARIWLCVSDDKADQSQPFPGDTGEVTWADNPATVCGVEYVRVDLVGKKEKGER